MDPGNTKSAGRLEITFHFIFLFPSAVFRGFTSALLTSVALTESKYFSADSGCSDI